MASDINLHFADIFNYILRFVSITFCGLFHLHFAVCFICIFMFENLCLRDISVYAGYYGGSVFHYHDNCELEVDAIVEMPDGAWGAFEIKLGEEQVEKAAKTLTSMKNKMVSAGAKAPACLLIITGGGIARIRDDGIYVLPITSIRH